MSKVNPRVLVIPNHQDWEYQTFEQLCVHVVRGTAPRYVEQSDVKAIGQRCVSKTGFDPSFARPHSERAMDGTLQAVDGDVLLNSTGTGTIGRSVVFRESGNFIVDGHVTSLRPKEGKCWSVWLSALLQSPWAQEHLERFCYAGSTNQVELSASALRVSEVPTPPYNEQSKIAEILDTLDVAIRGTQAVVAKLKAMKQGLLHDLLTRGIDANGELRPPQHEAPHLYKQTPLGWLPMEWDYSTLASAIATIDSGWSPACIETPPPAGEWGVLKVSAVTRGFYDDRQSKTLPSGMKPRPNLEVQNGDVILTRANGVAELVGKTVQVQNTQEKLMLSDKLLRLVPDKRKITNDFLAMLMTSETIVRQIEKSMSGSSGQKNISQSQIKSFACFIPLVDEQDEIAVRVAAFEARAAAEERELDKLRLQKSGMMEDLLTGRKPLTELL